MRKLLLGAGLFGLLSMPFTSKGQTVYFSDSFDNDINNWSLVDDDGDGNDWTWFNAGGAQGGVAASASWASSPLTPDNWMISPAFDLSSASGTLLLTWQVYAQDQSWAAENYTVYVGTSDNIGDLVTSPVNFTEVLTTSNGYMNRSLDVSSLAGNSAVYVAFRHHDVTDQFRMNIDNVQVIAPLDNDVEVVVAGMAPNVSLQDAPFNIQAIVRSNGINTMTSYDLSYTVNGGAATSANITGTSLDLFESEVVTHPNAWTPSEAGTYTIVVTADSPNGQTDGNTANNSFSFDVNVANIQLPRKPLYEVFTSSTCPPCTPGNANFHGIVANYPGDFVAVKYQQNFPGTGDPYATQEAIDRREDYYGVNSIPRMEIDGGWDGNANAFTAAIHEAAAEVPSFVDVDVTYSVDVANQTVEYCVIYNPLIDLGQAKLQIAILESITYDNVKTNGETEFENVMKKMIPNDNGESIELVAGSPVVVCDSYEFQGNYRLPINGQTPNLIDHSTEHSVEDFSNLYVIAWVEDANDLNVYQSNEGIEQKQLDIAISSYSSVDTIGLNEEYTILGNITNLGTDNISSYEIGYSIENSTETDSYSGVSVATYANNSFTHGTTWTTDQPGTYVVKAWTANPNASADQNTENDTMYTTLHVVGDVSVANQPQIEGSISLYPNPVVSTTQLVIRTEQAENLEISIVDLSGKIITAIGSTSTLSGTETVVNVDVSELTSGVYFIKVENDKGESAVQRFVKN